MNQNEMIKRELRLLDYLTEYSSFVYQYETTKLGFLGIPIHKEVETIQESEWETGNFLSVLKFHRAGSERLIPLSDVENFCKKFNVNFSKNVTVCKAYKAEFKSFHISVLENYDQIYDKMLKKYSEEESAFLKVVEKLDVLMNRLEKCVEDMKLKLKNEIMYDLGTWGEFKGKVTQSMQVFSYGIEWNYYYSEDINDKFSGFISFQDLQYENITEQQILALTYFLREYITEEFLNYNDEIITTWRNQNVVYKIKSIKIKFEISMNHNNLNTITFLLPSSKISLKKWN